ncbi:hypothetical protein [Leptothoe spongobia]|uniref:Uncharacterized protein n=1 Tax=Leptothoe spongobia TAU-MAC 1115 TaxID=1967444 RepID=A0A947DGV9_9CYAN|nr:hypothetical protein [Leptothoe spongobia]MBT9316838.1 hypothetical protein [Leptothoe spongobia TAU-MAC 1115]
MADPYVLPSSLMLAVMGINRDGDYGRRQCRMCDAGLLGTHLFPQVESH